MEYRELRIESDFLQNLISKQANALVGKCMKRFETLANKEDIKKEIKEVIYESMRDLGQMIELYGQGKASVVTFIEKSKEK